MAIDVVRGPAGAGKSQWIAERLTASGVVIDFTRLYAALAGVERGADGRYPVRTGHDPRIPLTQADKGIRAPGGGAARVRRLRDYFGLGGRGGCSELRADRRGRLRFIRVVFPRSDAGFPAFGPGDWANSRRSVKRRSGGGSSEAGTTLRSGTPG